MNSDYLKAISDCEQAGANLAPFAQMLAVYHRSLCESGFMRDEALLLVKDLQATIFSKAFNIGPQTESDDS